MGIVGYLKDKEEDTIETSPFIVIVHREYFNQGDIDSISVK